MEVDTISKHGIKIRNISAGSLYETNLGIRDFFISKEATLDNSLFYFFLKNNGLQVHKKADSGNRSSQKESTLDIVCLDFDFGSPSYETEVKKLTDLLNTDLSEEAEKRLEEILQKVHSQKDLYIPKKRNEIRDQFYNEGVDIGNIHYKMLFRTSAKAKLGKAIFINSRLYDQAYDWLTMGLGKKMPHNNAKIVELSAYAPLTTSTIIDTIPIPANDILILKDRLSVFRTTANIVKATGYTDKNGKKTKKCVVVQTETDVENNVWDGMGIIESSLLPGYINGMALLRNHFFKMCGMRGHITRFFQDWCRENGLDYETYQVQDMFGEWHYVKDIKVITTDHSIKWMKFTDLMGGTPRSAYTYWLNRIHADGDLWGVVKTDHPSKLGTFQQLSYQMVNSLPCTKEDMKKIAQTSVDYVHLLKNNNDAFEQFLRKNANEYNHYEMLADLYAQNHEFGNCRWFRNEKSDVLKTYIKRLRKGKIVISGDNLTVFGNPYAFLLYSVGGDWQKDHTLKPEKNCIQCFTTRFGNDQYLAAFRNPHNSPNNVCYMHNVYSKELETYFEFSPNIVAINCIGTDIQARANGMDEDSDFMLFTDHPTVVECAKKCSIEYPTIVNALQENPIAYRNISSDYAKIDHKLSGSQMGIGWSSNLAQLAMTYYWTEKTKDNPDKAKMKELYDIFVILSVIAQILIDGCKREYEIDGEAEIKRISKLPCMTPMKQSEMPCKNGSAKFTKCDLPLFMKYIKEIKYSSNGKPLSSDIVKKETARFYNRIDPALQCPMNWLEECLDLIPGASTRAAIPTAHFFIKMEGSANRRQVSKVQSLIMEYDHKIRSLKCSSGLPKEEYIEKLEEYSSHVFTELSRIKIGNPVTINRLIETALSLETNRNQKFYKGYETKYTRKTLNCLYKMDKERFLKNFL